MKFWKHGKDGGPYSTVDGYWLIEIKRLFSIALLRFGHGSRENYHSHAFNCVSWVFGPGQLREEHVDGRVQYHRRDTFGIVLGMLVALGLGFAFWDARSLGLVAFAPLVWNSAVITRRSTFHRVFSIGTTWVLTFRGPWSKTWQEHDPRTGEDITLTHGRKVVS